MTFPSPVPQQPTGPTWPQQPSILGLPAGVGLPGIGGAPSGMPGAGATPGLWQRLLPALGQIALSMGKGGGYRGLGFQQAQQQQAQNQLQQQQLALQQRGQNIQYELGKQAREAQLQREELSKVQQALGDFQTGLSQIDTTDAAALEKYAESIADTYQLSDAQRKNFMKIATTRAALPKAMKREQHFWVHPEGKGISASSKVGWEEFPDRESATAAATALRAGGAPTGLPQQQDADILAWGAAKLGKPITALTPAEKAKVRADYQVMLDQAKRTPTIDIPPEMIEPPGSESQSILAQTGLSLQGFYVLTGQMSSLSRDARTRMAAMREANQWANKHGIDVSAMGAQYRAYNDVLQRNIMRMSNSRVMENEIQGTIENLKGVVTKADLSRVNFANVVRVWGGQQVNDPLAQQYAMHLYQLRNELAGYAAALQGRNQTEINEADNREAEKVLKAGMGTGSLDGLSTAVANSMTKMGKVMRTSVDAARKAIWELFGVGTKFKSQFGTETGGPTGKTARPPLGSFEIPR